MSDARVVMRVSSFESTFLTNAIPCIADIASKPVPKSTAASIPSSNENPCSLWTRFSCMTSHNLSSRTSSATRVVRPIHFSRRNDRHGVLTSIRVTHAYGLSSCSSRCPHAQRGKTHHDRTSHYRGHTGWKTCILDDGRSRSRSNGRDMHRSPGTLNGYVHTSIAVHCRHTRQHELSGNFRRGLSKLRLHVPPKELWNR